MTPWMRTRSADGRRLWSAVKRLTAANVSGMQGTLQRTGGRERTPERNGSASPGRTHRTPLDDVQRQMRRQAAQRALSAQKPVIEGALLPSCMLVGGVLLLAKPTAESSWHQALPVLRRPCPHMPCALHRASSTATSACWQSTAPACLAGGRAAGKQLPGCACVARQRCRRCSRGCSSMSRRQARAPVHSLGTLLWPGPPGSAGRVCLSLSALLQPAAHCILHMVKSEQDAWPQARLGYSAAPLDLPLPTQPAHLLPPQHQHPAARPAYSLSSLSWLHCCLQSGMLQSSSQNYLGELRQFTRWPSPVWHPAAMLALVCASKVYCGPPAVSPKADHLLSLLHVHGQLHMHHHQLAEEAVDV